MKGIIMSGNHPLKVMDGSKTQTRRTAGLNEINKNPDKWAVTPTMNPAVWAFYPREYDIDKDVEHLKELVNVSCPYGGIGDRMWMKETILVDYHGFHSYYADYLVPEPLVTLDNLAQGIRDGAYRKKPSIHMPRKYSRAELEITGLRPERVKSITEADALNEGIRIVNPFCEGNMSFEKAYDINDEYLYEDAITAYFALWDSLNKERGYGTDLNPWVWAIKHRVV